MGYSYLKTSIYEYIIDVFILLAKTNYHYILVIGNIYWLEYL